MNTKVFAQNQISNLVMPVSYFVDHVKQLELLQSNLSKYRQASVIGLSGMGKTQIVRKYAYENKDKYDIIWFIDCNLDINQQLLKLTNGINAQVNSPVISDDISIVRKELMTYLTSKDKWLLVFDNLKISNNKKVEEFINWEHNGNIIFCSQDSELLPNIIKMSSFNNEDSLTLLQNILTNENPALINFLVQEFGGYPVLMVQGTRLLNQVQGLSIEEYKKKIKASNDKIGLNMEFAINELKPSAKRLLNEIALINNQNFSKELLSSITNNKDSLDDDIYQLSKFALISTTENDGNNPAFEMHDVISTKILEITGDKANKVYLEEIITKLISVLPKAITKAYIFRTANTMHENFEVILKNADNYNINVHKTIKLNKTLFANYLESRDYYNAAKQVNWFEYNDQQGKFKLWMMSNDNKAVYAGYIACIGTYYTLLSNYNKALQYYMKAQEILSEVKNNQDMKCSILFRISMTQMSLGRIQEAHQYINILEKIFNENLKEESIISIIGWLHLTKARLSYYQGDYNNALLEINRNIESFIKYGLPNNALAHTGAYIFKAEILNSLARYQEVYEQTKKLYDMHKLSKREDHEVFGRIFVQISRAKLGLGNIDEALEYAQKAKAIFINDTSRNNNKLITSSDTDLAKAYVAEGDALSALGENEKAIESYATAEIIYYNNYRENMKNVDEISKMYLSAVKAACKLPNKHWYSKFHNQHMEQFGAEHPRSIEILNLKCLN